MSIRLIEVSLILLYLGVFCFTLTFEPRMFLGSFLYEVGLEWLAFTFLMSRLKSIVRRAMRCICAEKSEPSR